MTSTTEEEEYCPGGKQNDETLLLTQDQQTWPDRCGGAELRLPDQDASSTRRVPGHRWGLDQFAHHL